MSQSDQHVSLFDYVFAGARHRCCYRVVGRHLAVVVGEREIWAELDRMEPPRLARILVHELLVKEAFVVDSLKRDRAPPKSSL